MSQIGFGATAGDDDDDYSFVSAVNSRFDSPPPSFASPQKTSASRSTGTRQKCLPIHAERALFELIDKFGSAVRFDQYICDKGVFFAISTKQLRNRFDYLTKLVKKNPTHYYHLRKAAYETTTESLFAIVSPVPSSVDLNFAASPLPPTSVKEDIFSVVSPLPSSSKIQLDKPNNTPAVMSDFHISGK
jgi:hypothetical protein